MSAPQGWYDAGTPGRQRWWDGSQWGPQERPAPTAAPPMGWYPVADSSDIRWWDGAVWAPYRVRDGKPRPDLLAVEPPSMGFFLAAFFFVIAMLQLSAALVTRNPGNFALPVLLLAAAVLWVLAASHSRAVRRMPAPQTAPYVDAEVHPLPGLVEGPDAGWHPVTSQVARWWTGARWTWYIGTKLGARPGHAGPRGYLVSMVLGWILAAIAALALVFAVVGAVVAQSPWTGFVIVLGVIIALTFGGLAVFVLLLTRSRRDAMLLPVTPPPLR